MVLPRITSSVMSLPRGTQELDNLRIERDELMVSAREERQALLAERERCAENAAEIDRLRELLASERRRLEQADESDADFLANP